MSPLYSIRLHAIQSCAPACLISWPAWKITSLGLFWPAWPPKAPPNPAACPQLIFLVATLLTAPPTDYVREEKEEREDCWGSPWAASKHSGFGPRGRSSPCFQHNHPPSPRAICMTPPLQLLGIMPADQTPNPFNICGCHFPSYPAQPFHPTHGASISQLSCVLILPFLLPDLPPFPCTCALFHFSQWPVQRVRGQQKCLWWESMWNKWRGNFSLVRRHDKFMT